MLELFVLELLVDVQNRQLVIIDPSGDVSEDGYFRVRQEIPQVLLCLREMWETMKLIFTP